MSIRLIAGEFRGRLLKVPREGAVRPSSARLREALFSILGGELEGWHVLDLFAGTGAIGYEAKSRGAAQVVFVESDVEVSKALEHNRRSLGCSSSEVEIRMLDASTAIRKLEAEGRTFDFVFADPPYALENLSALVEEISGASLLKPDGWFVLEHRAGCKIGTPAAFECFRRKRYGDSELKFYRRDS